MTVTVVYYPDISAFQAGIAIGGEVVCIKATEGTGWASSDYGPAVDRAKAAGTWPFAYHFLHQGNADAQAQFCHSHVGGMPLMIDWEPTTGSRPGVADAEQFIDSFRKLGGVTHLIYLPHWYWQQMGSPSLGSMIARGMSLVSSNYTSFTTAPDGVGWQPYGGMTPKIWQYTSSMRWHGQLVDFNGFMGTEGELVDLVSGKLQPAPTKPIPAPAFPYPDSDYLGQPSPDPRCHSGFYGGVDTVNVHAWQAEMAARGWGVTQDGRYGPQSASICRQFQTEKKLAVDGLVGPNTWKATWDKPVT